MGSIESAMLNRALGGTLCGDALAGNDQSELSARRPPPPPLDDQEPGAEAPDWRHSYGVDAMLWLQLGNWDF